MRLILFALLAVSAASAQQGNADAIVVKIPAATMPSTVILSASSAAGVPGRSVSVPIVLSLGGTIGPGSFQVDLTFDSTQLTFLSAAGLSSTVISAADIRLSTPAASPTGVPSGVAGVVSFAVASSFGSSRTAVNLVNCRSADPAGSPLSTGCFGGTVVPATCTITGDATPGVGDVQAMINQALGLASPVYDMNADGVVNVIDIQRELRAALGGTCIY